jgi:molybdopterin-guanine dinucleotide biosynthesis protein A
MTTGPNGFDAVVLAGGRGTRLAGADKAGIRFQGGSLLDRALVAVGAARQIVVVGPRRDTLVRVTWTREQPPGGGPAAALLAGLDALTGPAPLVAVVAVDMPWVVPATVDRLARAAGEDPAGDGAVLVDDGGRRQPLCATYRTRALVERAQDAHGVSVHRLLAGMRLVEVPAVGDEARDVDTWADLRGLGKDSGGTVA